MKFGDLQRIYGAAEKELRSLMLGIDLADFDGAKAETLKRKARRIVTYLNVISGRWTQRITREAYAKADKRTRAILARLGKTRARGPEPARSGPKAVQDIAETALLKAIGSIMQTVENYAAAAMRATQAIRIIPATIQAFAYGDVADKIDDLARKAVKKEMARGALQKQIMDTLEEDILDGNFITIVGKAGVSRTYNIRKYAKMVARTTLRDAQTAATIDNCKRYENDLVAVSSHGTDCAICAEYEGNIYSISGNDSKYPALDESPPFHPNCMHVITPTSEEEVYVRGLEA
jgi:hypothetical protein